MNQPNNLLQFPLRPAAHQAHQQTIFTKLREMGVANGFVMGTDPRGLPIFFCDPELSVPAAFYLMENARFRLMGRPPPLPSQPPPNPSPA